MLDAFLDYANTRSLAPKTIVGYELLAKQARAEFGPVDLRKLTAARLDLLLPRIGQAQSVGKNGRASPRLSALCVATSRPLGIDKAP